jgi:hypothetical protein
LLGLEELRPKDLEESERLPVAGSENPGYHGIPWDTPIIKLGETRYFEKMISY